MSELRVQDGRRALLVTVNSIKMRRGGVRVFDAITGEQIMEVVDIPHRLTCASALPCEGALRTWSCPIALGTCHNDVLLLDLPESSTLEVTPTTVTNTITQSERTTTTTKSLKKRIRIMNTTEIVAGRYAPSIFTRAYGDEYVMCTQLPTSKKQRSELIITFLTTLSHALAVGFASGEWNLWSLDTLQCVYCSSSTQDELPVTHMTLQHYFTPHNDVDSNKLTSFYLWVVRGSFSAPFLCVLLDTWHCGLFYQLLLPHSDVDFVCF